MGVHRSLVRDQDFTAPPFYSRLSSLTINIFFWNNKRLLPVDCISLTTARVVLFTRLRPVLVPTLENVFIWISECWSNFPGSLSFCTRPSVASLMCFILVWFMEYFPQPWHALLDKVSLLLHSCFVLTVAYKRRPFKCWRHNMYFKVASCACRQIFPAFSYSGLTTMMSLSCFEFLFTRYIGKVFAITAMKCVCTVKPGVYPFFALSVLTF